MRGREGGREGEGYVCISEGEDTGEGADKVCEVMTRK